MRSDLHRWLMNDGVRFFKNLGLQPGDRVLDFGCGDGVYTIPASKIVGKDGVVYALDRDLLSLKNLSEKASAMGIRNIIPVQTLNGLKRALNGHFLDAVLFIDVIHSYYFTENERARLLTSVNPVVKTNGFISIFPKHMEHHEIRSMSTTLTQLGFFFEKEQSSNLMHDGSSTYGFIMNFRKRGDVSDAENKTL